MMDLNSLINIILIAGIYIVLRTVLKILFRNNAQPENTLTATMPQDRPDERYFTELQRILPDESAKTLLDQHIESGACSRDLRMRANEFIMFFENTSNSLHSEEARILLTELTEALNALLSRSGNTADMDAIRPAVTRVNDAYLAYRSHFFDQFGR